MTETVNQGPESLEHSLPRTCFLQLVLTFQYSMQVTFLKIQSLLSLPSPNTMTFRAWTLGEHFLRSLNKNHVPQNTCGKSKTCAVSY